jgi:histidinol-phosphate/aromatic aminotransferase/cobyric acid decarboxylase-like protein
VLPRLVEGGKAVLLDPTYSEYEYLLRNLNCRIHRVALVKDKDWDIPLDSLLEACVDADMLVLVNPNNPTGRVLSLEALSELRKGMPAHAILWIDEAYIDYSERGSTFERIACELRGVYVLKSMSKAYALSGARAAYLICHPEAAAIVREWTPPWIIGTGAQLAAEAALRDEAYYKPLWRETIALAHELARSLRDVGLVVTTGDINAVLVQSSTLGATKWSEVLAESGLYVRTTLGMGGALGDSYVRISVVRREEISRLVAIVSQSLASGG